MGTGRSGLGRGVHSNTDYANLASGKSGNELANIYERRTGTKTDQAVIDAMSAENLGKFYNELEKARQFVGVTALNISVSTDEDITTAASFGPDGLAINIRSFKDIDHLNNSLCVPEDNGDPYYMLIYGPALHYNAAHSASSVLVHELGHQLNYELTQMLPTQYERNEAWFNSVKWAEIQSKISDPNYAGPLDYAEMWNTNWLTAQITEAYNKVTGDYGTYGYSKDAITLNRAIHLISGYAKTSYGEAVAESFAQVYEKGSDATPLAKSIVEHFRKLYKGGHK